MAAFRGRSFVENQEPNVKIFNDPDAYQPLQRVAAMVAIARNRGQYIDDDQLLTALLRTGLTPLRMIGQIDIVRDAIQLHEPNRSMEQIMADDIYFSVYSQMYDVLKKYQQEQRRHVRAARRGKAKPKTKPNGKTKPKAKAKPKEKPRKS